MGARGCASKLGYTTIHTILQLLLYICATSVAALPSLAPGNRGFRNARRRDSIGIAKRIVNDALIPNTKCFGDTAYAGWAMIIQSTGDTYNHIDVSGTNNAGTNVVDVPNCRNISPDQFNGLNVQTWGWNTDDSYRQPCQVFWLKSLPAAIDGAGKPIPGAFSISPNGKNTTLALASTQDNGWKPILKPPGLPEQTYQIMCDACDLDPTLLQGQMYLGTKCAISIRTTTDISVWTAQTAGQPVISMPYLSQDLQYFNILKIDESGKPLVTP